MKAKQKIWKKWRCNQKIFKHKRNSLLRWTFSFVFILFSMFFFFKCICLFTFFFIYLFCRFIFALWVILFYTFGSWWAWILIFHENVYSILFFISLLGILILYFILLVFIFLKCIFVVVFEFILVFMFLFQKKLMIQMVWSLYRVNHGVREYQKWHNLI